MPTTTNHGLPYPEGSDPAVVPADMQDLAEAVDTELDDIDLGQITGAGNGQLLIANSSGVITGRTVSGDITLSDAGVAQIGASKVVESKINNGAVTVNKIGTGAVNASKLGASAVETAKIKDAAVTGQKLNLNKDIATNGSLIGVPASGGWTAIAQTGSLPAGTYLVIATVTVTGLANHTAEIRLASGLSTMTPQPASVTSSSNQIMHVEWVHTQEATLPFTVATRALTSAGHEVPAGQGRIVAVRIG